jgi:exonuclease III
VTDHGTFVLFNLYVPNAGDRPARARLPAKLSFLAALKERVDDLLGAGRQVGGNSSSSDSGSGSGSIV